MRKSKSVSLKLHNRGRSVLLAAAAAVGLGAVAAQPVNAADRTWQTGQSGTWVNGGGLFTQDGGTATWQNESPGPDTFQYNQTDLSLITLDGILVATEVQNYNGGIFLIGSGVNLKVGATGANSLYIGRNSNSHAAVRQSGGEVSGRLFLGTSGGYGFYELTDGILNLASNSEIGGGATAGSTGVFYQSGSTSQVSTPNLRLNQGGSGTHAVYYITEGTVTVGEGINVNNGTTNGTAQLTIANATVGSSSPVNHAGALNLGSGGQAGQVSVLNLNEGGTLQVTRVLAPTALGADSVSQFNIDGGTIRSIRNSNGNVGGGADFIPVGHASIYIYGGGVTFDVSTNFTAGVAEALLAPTNDGLVVQEYELPVGERGAGYVGAPVVKIGGATGATAVANMEPDGSGGLRVRSITVTGAGIDASASPTYEFIGGGFSTGNAAKDSTNAGTLALETAANVSGGLVKKGVGPLQLGGANTYTGETRIEAGTLSLHNAGDLSASSAVNVLEGAIFDSSGKVGAVVKGLKGAGEVFSRNDGTVANRLLVQNLVAPGDNGVGTLTISNGDLRVGDGAVYEYEIGGTTASPTSDLIDIIVGSSQGDLTFDGDWTLSLANLGTVDPTGLEFVLFDYTSGAHPTLGTVTIDHGSTNWVGGLVSIDTTNRRVILTDLEVIPEPSALALIGLAALPMLRRRRR